MYIINKKNYVESALYGIHELVVSVSEISFVWRSKSDTSTTCP